MHSVLSVWQQPVEPEQFDGKPVIASTTGTALQLPSRQQSAPGKNTPVGMMLHANCVSPRKHSLSSTLQQPKTMTGVGAGVGAEVAGVGAGVGALVNGIEQL
jgi:hypothetical protein